MLTLKQFKHCSALSLASLSVGGLEKDKQPGARLKLKGLTLDF